MMKAKQDPYVLRNPRKERRKSEKQKEKSFFFK